MDGRWSVAALVAIAGCGRIAFEPIGDGGAASADADPSSDAALSAIAQRAYVKASNAGANDTFGYSVALSADGSTLAVGAVAEDSAAVGIGGNQADNSAASAGAVYVFNRTGLVWTQQAYLKASNTGAGDNFGLRLALTGDGSTLAVGAPFEDSDAIGIGGTQTDNSAIDAGAVYLFTRAGTTWTQSDYIKASNTGAGDNFGYGVALSDDGTTLAVGAYQESSNATGVGGNQGNNAATDSGAVYVFTQPGGGWVQQAYIKASNTDADDGFGEAVSLSTNGSTLVAGARGEASLAPGIGGNEADNSGAIAGAAYVFTRVGSTWSQQAYVKASNPGAGDNFAVSVSISGDGATLAVGSCFEASNATGVDGNQADESATGAGAVYVFTRAGAVWTQQAYVKASTSGAADQFGVAVDLSTDGSTLAIAAYTEPGAATGINGNEANRTAVNAGAAFAFTRATGTWTQRAYVKASNASSGDQFGSSIALSSDASTVAVGAYREASAATGVGGNEADNSAAGAGAVYVFQ